MGKVDKVRSFLNAAAGEFLWAVILIPILAISWVGFYTIARGIGIPPIFAAGMSAAFDGIALFAARIGLKHRRKGFSGYLARITVVAFAALGAFVQSFHGRSETWIHAHNWIVWATLPIAACLAYELHLGWVHRKQLIRKGYVHPSAKSGFGPATWLVLGGTWSEYRKVLRARRDFIAKSNLQRFESEESAQLQLETITVQPVENEQSRPILQQDLVPVGSVQLENAEVSVPEVESSPKPKPNKPKSSPKPKPKRTVLHSVPAPRQSNRKSTSSQAAIRDWVVEHGFELGFNGRIPIAGLNAYRAAQREGKRAS